MKNKETILISKELFNKMRGHLSDLYDEYWNNIDATNGEMYVEEQRELLKTIKQVEKLLEK